MTSHVLELERDAFEAWPAAEVADLHGWRLRFNHGVTKRGNSVWPNAWTEGPPLGERIQRVEAFYAERRRPAIFQLTEAARPAGLDRALEGRGYASHAPVLVQEASSGAVASACADDAERAVWEERLGEGWFEFSGRRGRFRGSHAEVYRALLERIAAPCCYAAARTDGRVLATGLGVLGRGRAGVFSMRTHEAHRSQGLGRAVLGAIARWADARGARSLYLQVEEDNPSARALYARAGFATTYRYHYRRQGN